MKLVKYSVLLYLTIGLLFIQISQQINLSKNSKTVSLTKVEAESEANKALKNKFNSVRYIEFKSEFILNHQFNWYGESKLGTLVVNAKEIKLMNKGSKVVDIPIVRLSFTPKSVILNYKDFVPYAEKNFLSYKDYQFAMAAFFKKAGISPDMCEFILPKIKSTPSIVALCLDSSSDDREGFGKLKESVSRNYATAIKKEDINNIPPLDLNINHDVQYHADGTTGFFYMSMTDHGVVLSAATEKKADDVQYSFRYDQLYKCAGEHDPRLKHIKKKEQVQIKKKGCCAYYQVDWSNKPEDTYICDISDDDTTCIVKLKLYMASINRFCLTSQSKTLSVLITETQQGKFNANALHESEKNNIKSILESNNLPPEINKLLDKHRDILNVMKNEINESLKPAIASDPTVITSQPNMNGPNGGDPSNIGADISGGAQGSIGGSGDPNIGIPGQQATDGGFGGAAGAEAGISLNGDINGGASGDISQGTTGNFQGSTSNDGLGGATGSGSINANLQGSTAETSHLQSNVINTQMEHQLNDNRVKIDVNKVASMMTEHQPLPQITTVSSTVMAVQEMNKKIHVVRPPSLPPRDVAEDIKIQIQNVLKQPDEPLRPRPNLRRPVSPPPTTQSNDVSITLMKLPPKECDQHRKEIISKPPEDPEPKPKPRPLQPPVTFDDDDNETFNNLNKNCLIEGGCKGIKQVRAPCSSH